MGDFLCYSDYNEQGGDMSSNFGKIFGGIVAVILLLLYVITMGFLVAHVITCGYDANCVAPFSITSGMIFVLTTVSGLVSALVVATLAIAEPGGNPSRPWFGDGTSKSSQTFITYLVGIYLGVWVLAGLTALIVGVMIYPGANQTLSDTGTTWLGLAVAAAYAYFGIKSKS
jgi:hypothetical protein